jgi:hypothetical protein
MTSSSESAPPSADSAPRGRWAWLVVALVLAAQNAALFFGHYAGTLTFPFDFQKTYHAVPFFWTTAVSAGIFPTWVPYQGVGSPLLMNLQSGIFYPPLWTFPALHLTYSLHAATVLQALHVGLGALGMSWLARVRGLPWRYALLAGAAYQVSGGFFCNAEHPDIVRGYAWTPWLLAALSARADERSALPLRALFLPAIVYLVLTGAYPGQSMAALALSFVVLGAELLQAGTPRRSARERLLRIAPRAGLLVLGVLMAMVHLLPAWLQRSQVLLARDTGNEFIWGLDFKNLFTTFLPYDPDFLGGPRTMRSLFVTVPICAGAFWLDRRVLRTELPLVALLLAAAVMIHAGAVFQLVTRLIPPLGMSRFPAADYRGLVLVPLVLLGVHGARHVLEERARLWVHALRSLAFLAFIWAGCAVWREGAALSWEHAVQLAAVLGGTALVLLLGRFRSLGPRYGAVALACLAVGDGYRLHDAIPEKWQAKLPRKLDYEEMKSELCAELRQERTERPARREMPTFDGYLRGRYVLYDYAASDRLAGPAELLARGPLKPLIKRPSSPALLAEDAAKEPLAALGRPLDPSTGSVKTEAYGAERVRYAISTRAPAVLVENELAFPGWTAVREDDATEVESIAAAWPLRAWRLPAGEYSLALTFRMPGLRTAAVVSLTAIAAWLALLAARRFRARGSVAYA